MPRIIDHDARRAQIFEGSIALFSAHGFVGLGMRQLAKDLGVSTGTLYHYFPNKLLLFEGMMRYLATDHVAIAVSSLGDIEDKSARIELLHAFLVAQSDRIRQVLYVAIDYRRSVGVESQPLIGEVFGVYLEAIAEQFTDGDVVSAREILSFVVGVLVYTGLQVGEESVEDLLAPIARLVPKSSD
jgi:AcrR family transcriptional regulator